jgi:hypothetical protein
MKALDTKVLARFFVDDADDAQAARQRPEFRQRAAFGTQLACFGIHHLRPTNGQASKQVGVDTSRGVVGLRWWVRR